MLGADVLAAGWHVLRRTRVWERDAAIMLLQWAALRGPFASAKPAATRQTR